jgi:hypothetical protein
MFETNPENAPVIEKIADMLAAVSIGDTIAYRTINAATDRDVTGRHRHLLQAAREQAEKNLGCLFECVRSVGIKRMTADAAPDVGLQAIRHIRKTAKRGARRLERISTNSLTDGEVKRVVGFRSMLGAIALVADGNKARTVAAVIDPVRPIPPESILDMFRK